MISALRRLQTLQGDAVGELVRLPNFQTQTNSNNIQRRRRMQEQVGHTHYFFGHAASSDRVAGLREFPFGFLLQVYSDVALASERYIHFGPLAEAVLNEQLLHRGAHLCAWTLHAHVPAQICEARTKQRP